MQIVIDLPDFIYDYLSSGETLPKPWFMTHLVNYSKGVKTHIWAKEIVKPKTIFEKAYLNRKV